MNIVFLNKGNKTLKVNKEKIHYHKNLSSENKSKILGYVELSSFRKKKVNIEDCLCLFKILNKKIPLYGFYEDKINFKKICGYLEVETEEGVSYVAIMTKYRFYKLFPFASLLPQIITTGGATVAIAATTTVIVISSLTIIKNYIKDKEQNVEESKKPENTEGEYDLNFSDEEDSYDGKALDIGEDEPLGDNDVFVISYFDVILNKGDAIPLVNDPENDVILEYDILCDNKTIFKTAVNVGKSVNWVPSNFLKAGDNEVTFVISSYDLDKKKRNDVVTKNKFKITINN